MRESRNIACSLPAHRFLTRMRPPALVLAWLIALLWTRVPQRSPQPPRIPNLLKTQRNDRPPTPQSPSSSPPATKPPASKPPSAPSSPKPSPSTSSPSTTAPPTQPAPIMDRRRRTPPPNKSSPSSTSKPPRRLDGQNHAMALAARQTAPHGCSSPMATSSSAPNPRARPPFAHDRTPTTSSSPHPHPESTASA